MQIIEEARRRAGRKKKLTLILRDLGGLDKGSRRHSSREKEEGRHKGGCNRRKAACSIDRGADSLQELEFRKDYRVFNTNGYA